MAVITGLETSYHTLIVAATIVYYSFSLSLHYVADKTVFTDNDMEMVKKECQDLDELLISASAVELMIVLGEGIAT